ncbi:hypothetical protein KAR48_08625 [bacterium]|nr:hypothetical protein [bacterium]
MFFNKFKCVLLFMAVLGLTAGCVRIQNESRDVALEGISYPARLYVQDDCIYITHATDSLEKAAEVLVYDRNTFKFKFRFAGIGEEAGKIQMIAGHSIYLAFPPGKVAVNGNQIVVFFDRNGQYIEEKEIQGAMIQAWEGGYVAWSSFNDAEGVNQYALNWFDKDLKFKKECYRIENQYHTVLKKNRLFTRDLEFRVGGNFLFAKGVDNDFVISAFAPGGVLSHRIHHDYDRLLVTEAHRQSVLAGYRNHPLFGRFFDRIEKEIIFADTLPAIRTLRADEKYLYAQMYRQEEGRTEFIVMDHQGKIESRQSVPFVWKDILENNPYDVRDDVLYQLVQRKDEKGWWLRIIPLEY